VLELHRNGSARCCSEREKRKTEYASHVDFTGLGLTSDQSLPGLVALVNDLGSVLAVLGLTGEGELETIESINIDDSPLIEQEKKLTWFSGFPSGIL